MESKHRLNALLEKLGYQTRGTGSSLRRRIVRGGETMFEGTARETWQWLRDSGQLPYKREPSPRQKLAHAMRNSDYWACRIVYRDRVGKFTSRTISPIRFTNNDRNVMALCVGREECRHFIIAGIQSIELVTAESVLMGSEPVTEISDNKHTEQSCNA